MEPHSNRTNNGPTPESRALRNNLSELTDILTTTVGPVWLATQLYECKFVSNTRKENILSAHGMGDYDKVSQLVAIVCEQVEQDYSKYDDFIQILQRETCLDHITEKLECSLQSKSLSVIMNLHGLYASILYRVNSVFVCACFIEHWEEEEKEEETLSETLTLVNQLSGKKVNEFHNRGIVQIVASFPGLATV